VPATGDVVGVTGCIAGEGVAVGCPVVGVGSGVAVATAALSFVIYIGGLTSFGLVATLVKS
jgi:hypothetical protein